MHFSLDSGYWLGCTWFPFRGCCQPLGHAVELVALQPKRLSTKRVSENPRGAMKLEGISWKAWTYPYSPVAFREQW